jgi:hypothetical protein
MMAYRLALVLERIRRHRLVQLGHRILGRMGQLACSILVQQLVQRLGS